MATAEPEAPLKHAPGAPGIAPSWTSSAKDMVGTSLGPARLWFTLGFGIVNEIYYPRVFNQLIRDALENGNPMGWSTYTVTLAQAIAQGLVEKINEKTGATESRSAFYARLESECIDQEQWNQEYCCIPVDE